jgi:hypothetical protein
MTALPARHIFRAARVLACSQKLWERRASLFIR